MTDEHLTRHWADAHSEFSSDLDLALARLGSFVKSLLRGRQTIGSAYGSAEMSEPARAALAGVLACLATTGVLLALSALFPADLSAHAVARAPVIAHTIVA